MIAGNPWSRVNISAITPLSGIYFINDLLSNQVVQANAADKYPLLWQHSLPSKNATESKQIFNLFGRLVEQVRFMIVGESPTHLRNLSIRIYFIQITDK